MKARCSKVPVGCNTRTRPALRAPVCAAPALQLAIFAHHLPMDDTASYVAVGATIQFVAALANFLLVVSMARVSHALSTFGLDAR